MTIVRKEGVIGLVALVMVLVMVLLGPAPSASGATVGKVVFTKAKLTNDGIPGCCRTTLWTMTLGGSATTIPGDEWYRNPEWSPDGTKIAYQVGDGWLPWGDVVFVADTDGSDLTRIGLGNDPSWSPDGSHLVYTVFNFAGLHIAAADKTSYETLSGPVAPSQPDWSPDGKRIVYVENVAGAGESYRLKVYDLDTDQNKPITGIPSNYRSPAWSPDGLSIAAVKWGGKGSDIVVIDADGSNPSIFRTKRNEWDVTWSPDGSQLMFTGQMRKTSDLFVMDADGSNVTRITDTPTRLETSPSWVSG